MRHGLKSPLHLLVLRSAAFVAIQVRIPLSGRKYRVFLGPGPGMYAESVAKAWGTQRRADERKAEVELATAEEVKLAASGEAPGKKKRPRKICFPCDFGRKRKCTCGRRSRVW